MTSETLPPLPPPPPEAPLQAAADDQTSSAATSKIIINQSAITAALNTLERIRSLETEREACTLFASSLLSHPLGAVGASSTSPASNFADISAADAAAEAQKNKLEALDPLHPRSLPGGVRDAWASLTKSSRTLNVLAGEVDDMDIDKDDALLANNGTITASMIENELAKEKRHENEQYSLNNGQLSIACRTVALKVALAREVELTDILDNDAKNTALILKKARKEIDDANNDGTGSILMDSFYERLKEVKQYQSLNPGEANNDNNMSALIGQSSLHAMLLSGRKRKHGHPLADGYDIASLIATETSAVRSGELFSPEELFGKYLDLVPVYESEVRHMRHAFADGSSGGGGGGGSDNLTSNLSYLDFLSILSKGLNTSIPEAGKLRDRRKYARFLRELEKYLTGFLKRTCPFLNVSSEVIAPAIASFEKEWAEKGGVTGWECRQAEASMVLESNAEGNNGQSSNDNGIDVCIDLSKFATSSDLEKAVSGDELKSELARLGLKCGGTVSDRAARLFLTKDTPLDKLPAKVFAKRKGGGAKKPAPSGDAVPATKNETPGSDLTEVVADRRVDIARLESIVSSLIDQLRPTLDGTRRRVERRATQTENERDQEIDEEVNGAKMDEGNTNKNKTRDGDVGSDDEDDEDDTPIYNPKNVPLGWDGKPIPYWLFKLHGLNHFYPCEICGNEAYRGRRNFEKHFTESRHAYGMRCLGIPNTKHFHGVTKIEDAQELWSKLKTVLEGNQFDGIEEEEYEDSNGNVIKRAQYEDLARQGLL
jgi:splicing factor 3A subunit 3